MDQTFTAREVQLGNMTKEQAKTDERRNMLLQCIGASDEVHPDLFFGNTRKNAIYMLCSDGFPHELSAGEIYEKLQPEVLYDVAEMNRHAEELIELDKMRMELDNISVILIKTF